MAAINVPTNLPCPGKFFVRYRHLENYYFAPEML
jgi:hypothetical protein